MTEFLKMDVTELPDNYRVCLDQNCSFTRSSVAYDYMGREVPANYPRFTHKVPNLTVTNLLTGNQSDGGDTLNPELLTLNQRTGTDALGDTTGFESAASATITSSTEQAHTGTRSLKVVTPGVGGYEGIITGSITVAASTSYIFGCWVYAPLNSKMAIGLIDKIDSASQTLFTGTGGWQWVQHTATTDTHTVLYGYVTTDDSFPRQAVTFYVDDCRLSTNVTTGYMKNWGDEVISVTGEQSYKGYRSFKITTLGNHTEEGMYGLCNVEANTVHTLTVRVKGEEGKGFRMVMGAGFGVSATNFTLTGGWDSFSITSTGGTGGNSDFYLLANPTNASATNLYIDYCMLETGSVAHDWAYGQSSYSTYKTEYGCLIEEAHTNLLTANQSTCTDTSGNTTGFTSSAGGVISSSTDQKLQGSKSLKVVTVGSASDEGVLINANTVTENTTHTLSGWVNLPLGEVISFSIWTHDYGHSTRVYYTGTGSWQFMSATLAVPAGHTSVIGSVSSGSGVIRPATTFYVDMLSLTATAYPLSWCLGGTTVNAETLTAPSSVLNIDTEGYSNLLTANQANACEDGTTTGFGTASGTISVESTEHYQGSKCLKTVTGAVQYQGSTLMVGGVVGVTYTLTGKIKGTTNETIYLTGSGASFTAPTLTMTGGWDDFTITYTATNTSPIFRWCTPDSNSRTFYLDQLQVTATNTAKPWIPGGTQVNSGTGTIEMEFLVNEAVKRTAPLNTGSYLLHMWSDTDKNAIALMAGFVMAGPVNTIRFATSDNRGSSSYKEAVISPSQLSLGSIKKYSVKWDKDEMELFIDGVSSASNTSPNLPVGRGSLIYIGSKTTGTNQWANTIIRNVTISRPKREDADITARATANSDDLGFPLDEDVVFVYPLKEDLAAYRVRIK